MTDSRYKVKRAIIMAAGKGERLRPITSTIPKPLIVVNGTRIIDGLINNLYLNGIHEIYVVVGFHKDRFIEWNLDFPDVKLIENPYYDKANNISSLYVARDYLEDAIILDGDQIITDPKVLHAEFDISGYAAELIDGYSEEWILKVKNGIIQNCLRDGGSAGYRLYSVSRWDSHDGRRLAKLVEKEFIENKNLSIYWDDVPLFCYPKEFVLGVDHVTKGQIIEIDTVDELAEMDLSYSEGTSIVEQNKALCQKIAEILDVSEESVENITAVKKGMTNRTYTFTCLDMKYLLRVPGEGTQQLIDRKKEEAVYREISGRGYCDDPIYINSQDGYKITKYIEGIRVCDAHDINDLRMCMSVLRRFHTDSIPIDHSFDLYQMIDYYERLRNGRESVYQDYEITKQNVFSLKPYIESHIQNRCLTHIDAVPDNFILYEDENGGTNVQLIDWEYAGMQDPHVDIAMFCIYSQFDRMETDQLIDIYFEDQCDPEIRIKIYCYMAVCGLLWSNWCEYKAMLGVDFKEYSLAQYKYAVDYYAIAYDLISQLEE